MKSLILALGLALFQVSALAIWPTSASADERKQIAAQIHRDILKGWEEYGRIRRDKVLAGCINWQNSSLSSLDLRHLNAYSTDVASDVPIFVSKLKNRAITACDRQRRSKNLNCECVLIDVNGKSVLEVPASFVASASVDRAVKCRLPDGDVLITVMSSCRAMGGEVIAE